MQRLPIRIIVPAMAALTALSCGPQRSTPLAGETLVVFPPPPDTARIQFLTRLGNSRDITDKRASFWQKLIGESDQANAGRPIIKPYGLAVHQGKLYVCDTILRGIEVIDLERRTFEYFLPDGEGKLRKPINCFIDKTDGRLYVTDTERQQVVVFDGSGRYVGSIGALGEMKPTDVFVDERGIWVTDLAQRQVRRYDKATWSLMSAFPSVGADTTAGLYSPTNLYVLGDRVYVTDFGDFQIKIYSTSGAYLAAVGSYGRNLGQFARPKGVAVDRDGRLYVVDAGFENVQVFDRDGQLLMFFGGQYRGPGYMWLPAKVVIDYDNLAYFQRYVDRRFKLRYLVFVTNQYGPDKVSVYGFVDPARPTTSEAM